MRRRIAWPDLPIMLAGALWFIGAALLIAQVGLGAVAHGKRMKLCADVFGVTVPDQAAFSVPNLLSGKYQRSLAVRIGREEPYFPVAVRLRDQLEYSIFSVSATPTVLVGNHRQLIESVYIDDYCSRNLPAFLGPAPAWAGKIRAMQNFFESRGQSFLYVVTPSKVAMYPQILPAGLACPSTEADRTRLVPDWVHIVRQAGVHVVDTTAVLRAAQGDYPFALFPRSGIHWNDAGAALGTQAMESGLETMHGDRRLAPFSFTWKLSSVADKDDTDLGFLMNLFWLPKHFASPVISMTQAPPPPACRPVHIVIVAGSFMEHVGPLLSQLPCAAPVVEYFYWKLHRDVWTDGVRKLEPAVDPGTRDADLRRADVIIYEENEALLGHSQHGAAFYDWVQSQPAGR